MEIGEYTRYLRSSDVATLFKQSCVYFGKFGNTLRGKAKDSEDGRLGGLKLLFVSPHSLVSMMLHLLDFCLFLHKDLLLDSLNVISQDAQCSENTLECLEVPVPLLDLTSPVVSKNEAPKSDKLSSPPSTSVESPAVKYCSNSIIQDAGDYKVRIMVKAEAVDADQLNDGAIHVASLYKDFADAAATKDIKQKESYQGNDCNDTKTMHRNEYGRKTNDSEPSEIVIDNHDAPRSMESECVVTDKCTERSISSSTISGDAETNADLLNDIQNVYEDVAKPANKKQKPNDQTLATPCDETRKSAETHESVQELTQIKATSAPVLSSWTIAASKDGIVHLRTTQNEVTNDSSSSNETLGNRITLRNDVTDADQVLPSESDEKHSNVPAISQSAATSGVKPPAYIDDQPQHQQERQDEVQHDTDEKIPVIQAVQEAKTDHRDEKCGNLSQSQSAASEDALIHLNTTQNDVTNEQKQDINEQPIHSETLRVSADDSMRRPTVNIDKAAGSMEIHSEAAAVSYSAEVAGNDVQHDLQVAGNDVQHCGNHHDISRANSAVLGAEEVIDNTEGNASSGLLCQSVTGEADVEHSSMTQNDVTIEQPSSSRESLERSPQVDTDVTDTECTLSSKSSEAAAIFFCNGASDSGRAAEVPAGNDMQHTSDFNQAAIHDLAEAEAEDNMEKSARFGQQCNSAASERNVEHMSPTLKEDAGVMTSSCENIIINVLNLCLSGDIKNATANTEGELYNKGSEAQNCLSNDNVETQSNVSATIHSHSATVRTFVTSADVKEQPQHKQERQGKMRCDIIEESSLKIVVESEAKAEEQTEVTCTIKPSAETNESRSEVIISATNQTATDAATNESFTDRSHDIVAPTPSEMLETHSSAAASAFKTSQELADQVQHGQKQEDLMQQNHIDGKFPTIPMVSGVNDDYNEKKSPSTRSEVGIGQSDRYVPSADANDSSQDVFSDEASFQASAVGGASSDIMADFYEDLGDNASNSELAFDAVQISYEDEGNKLATAQQINIPSQALATFPESQQPYSSLVLKKFKMPFGKDYTPYKCTLTPDTAMDSSSSSAGDSNILAQPSLGLFSPPESEALSHHYNATSADNTSRIRSGYATTPENSDGIAQTNFCSGFTEPKPRQSGQAQQTQSITQRHDFDEELARERVKVADAIMHRAEEVMKKERQAMMHDFQKEKDALLREVSEGYQEQWSEMQRDITSKKETEIATKAMELRDDWKRRNRTTANLQEELASNTEAQALLLALKEQWASECDDHLKARDLEVKSIFKDELCAYRDEIRKEIEAERDEYVERAVMNARVEWDREQLNLKDNAVNKL